MAGQKTQFPDVVYPFFPGTSAFDFTSSHTGFFLTRLARLLHLLGEWESRVSASDWHLRLIQKVIYSTYCDCRGAGIQNEARRLVEQHRQARKEPIEFVS